MSLAPGTRFGPYEIRAALGAGGMGEVYRARDTRLERDVAVKILPEHLADAGRRERFQREARAVAALSHPNICTIHDVGHEAGVDFLVMEFIDGESLATRLSRGPLPLTQALNLAVEIAEALASAHRHGIVHRDLKPGNVMLTRSGSGRPHATHAKVLDFGLARILTYDEGNERDTLKPTAAAPLTETGSMLGTLQYMAPEQIEGHRVDARTDVFAFGALLFEMLTGRRAFEASSSPRLMAAILQGESPSLASYQPSLPPSLDWIVRTCLEKEPEDRFASMHDVLLQLRQISTSDKSAIVAAPVPRPRSSRAAAWVRGGLIAAVALAMAAAGFWRGRASNPQVSESPLMATVLPPEGTEPGMGLSVSPDGQSLVVAGVSGPGLPPFLWVRHLGSNATTPLRGTEGASYPFWSPDGRSIAFFADGKLKRTDLQGGTPVVIADVEQGRGATWMEDGTIVLGALEARGLLRVPASGGTPTEIVSNEEGSGIANLRFPVRVGSRQLIYLALGDEIGNSEIRLTSLDNPGASQTVVRTQRSGAYANGLLLFDRNDVIVAQPFEPETGALTGEPEPLAETPREPIIGYLSVASGGRTIAWHTRRQPTGQLTWLGRDGVAAGTLGVPDSYGNFALSPDGGRLAVVASSQLLIMDTMSGTRQEIASEPGVRDPRWSPDGTRVAFVASLGPNASLNVYGVTLTPPFRVEPLVEGPLLMGLGGWTPRGDLIWLQPRAQSVTASRPGPAWINERGALMRSPGGEPALVAAEALGQLVVSPDGVLMAYRRQIAGRWDVCLDRIDPPRGCRPVAAVTATQPLALTWRADGRELLFRTGDEVMSVPLQPGTLPENPRAVRLFQSRGTAGLAVTSTGDRFLVLEPRTTPPPTLSVAINWSPGGSR